MDRRSGDASRIFAGKGLRRSTRRSRRRCRAVRRRVWECRVLDIVAHVLRKTFLPATAS
jgi:hypothetical protein